jgi:hypothetical protein
MAVGDSRTFSGTVAAVPSATEILFYWTGEVGLSNRPNQACPRCSFRNRSLFFTIRQALLPTCKLAIESPSWESISVQLL